MSRFLVGWGTLVLAVVPLLGQEAPFVSGGGVVNAASFTPNSLPGGGIAQGSIFSIFGRDLGPTTPVQVASFPLGASLQGVSIQVRQGSTTLDAIPLFVLASQINAIMPSATPVGQVTLRVSYNGRAGNWVPVTVVAHAPGVFTATGIGKGWTIFQNFIDPGNQPLNSGRTAAKPGQVGTLWLTGAGAIRGADGNSPPVGDHPYNVEIFVGGRRVTSKLYSGRAPGISGLDQFVFAVPADAPTGCFVPIYVRVNGAVSNSTTMAIMPEGGACADAHNPVSAEMIKGGKVVQAVLSRIATDSGVIPGVNLRLVTDVASVRTREEPGGVFAFDPFLAAPPAGACTSYTFGGNVIRDPIQFASPGRTLALGDLAADSGASSVKLGPRRAGLISETIGGGFPVKPPFFVPTATASLRASGGAGGGAFVAPVPSGQTLDGAKLAALTLLDREGSAAVQWTGQPNVSASISGAVYHLATDSSAYFLCVSELGASSFTIPDYVLAGLPATEDVAPAGSALSLFSAWPVFTSTTTADQIRIFTARQNLYGQAIISVQ